MQIILFVILSCSFCYIVSGFLPSHRFGAHTLNSRIFGLKAFASTNSKVMSHDDVIQKALLAPRSEDAVSPEWFESMKLTSNAKLADVQEWQDEEWRTNEGGFTGRDFIHSKSASVRILDYLIVTPSTQSITDVKTEQSLTENLTDFPMLIGPAYFSSKAESHKGLCHGGSFCALMDDAIGWMGFCVSSNVRPWTGFTVQINTSLKKPVQVGSTLKVEAWVNRKEGSRKYWITSRLIDVDSGDIHCEAEGLFLMNPDQVEDKSSF